VTVLATANLRLAPLVSTDRADLFAHLSDAATVEFMDIPPMADLTAADAMIDWAAGLAVSGGAWWAMRDTTGTFVGTAGIVVHERHRGARGEVSYNVVRRRWRNGVMTEALPAIVAHAHGPLGLRRLEALVTPGNVASGALLRRFGFRCEGLLRDYGWWKDRFWDQELYARLADDPSP
jgi:ribosomal-protein-alanine N-acetyltransferase